MNMPKNKYSIVKIRDKLLICLIAFCLSFGAKTACADVVSLLRPTSLVERQVVSAQNKRIAVQRAVEILRRQMPGLNRIIENEITRLPADSMKHPAPRAIANELKRIFIEMCEAGEGIPEFDGLKAQLVQNGFSARRVTDYLMQPFFEAGIIIFVSECSIEHNGRQVEKLPFVMVDNIVSSSVEHNSMLGVELPILVIEHEGKSPIATISAQDIDTAMIYGVTLNGVAPVFVNMANLESRMRERHAERARVNSGGVLKLQHLVTTGYTECDMQLSSLLAKLLRKQWVTVPPSFEIFQRHNREAFRRRVAAHEEIHQMLGPFADDREVYLAELATSPLKWLILYGILGIAYDNNPTVLTAHKRASLFIVDNLIAWIYRLQYQMEPGAHVSAPDILGVAESLSNRSLPYYATIIFMFQLRQLRDHYKAFVARGLQPGADLKLYEACKAASVRVEQMLARLNAEFRPYQNEQMPDISLRSIRACDLACASAI